MQVDASPLSLVITKPKLPAKASIRSIVGQYIAHEALQFAAPGLFDQSSEDLPANALPLPWIDDQ